MRIAELYCHKDGEKVLCTEHPQELKEIYDAVEQLDAEDILRKTSSERTKQPLLFSPVSMNESIKQYLCPLGWTEHAPGTTKGFKEPRVKLGPREFREMDGIKNRVGLEIQFGKYAFMGYDIFSKMPIFAAHGLIHCGVELVVMPSMIRDMSTGVSSFAQITMDMKARGVADLDLPTIVLGIEPTAEEWERVNRKRLRFHREPETMFREGLINKPRKGAKPGPK